MKHYSPEARNHLFEIYNDFVDNLPRNDDGKYVNHPFSNGDIYYHPDEDKAYLTPSGAFKALPYDVVKAYCSGWTGYLTGVDTYDFLEGYVRDFDVLILTQSEYESLDEEDWKSPDNSYRQAWEKVIEAMADALIDSWHSLCTARGIQLRKGK